MLLILLLPAPLVGASEQIVDGLPRDPELSTQVGHGVALVQEFAQRTGKLAQRSVGLLLAAFVCRIGRYRSLTRRFTRRGSQTGDLKTACFPIVRPDDSFPQRVRRIAYAVRALRLPYRALETR